MGEVGNPSKPPFGGNRPSRFENWTLAVSLLSLIFSGVALYITLRHDESEKRKDAAIRVCEVYASGDMMAALRQKLFEGSFPNHKKGEDDITEKSFDRIKGPSYASQDFKHQAFDWLNFLDMIATGLDEERYDQKIIKGCFGRVFATARDALIVPYTTSVSDIGYFNNVSRWANTLAN